MLICSPLFNCVCMMKEFQKSYNRYEVDYIKRNSSYNHVLHLPVPVKVKVKLALKAASTTVTSELSKATLVY